MKCEFCGAELREGSKYCTQCGSPVQTPVRQDTAPQSEPQAGPQPGPQAGPASDPSRSPDALNGYRSYTSGDRQRTAPSSRPVRNTSEKIGGDSRDWTAGAALGCAICSVATIVFCIPGIVFGIGALIFGILGRNSNLRLLAIGSIVLGILGILGSGAMMFVWSGVLGLLQSLVGSLSFPNPFFW